MNKEYQRVAALHSSVGTSVAGALTALTSEVASVPLQVSFPACRPCSGARGTDQSFGLPHVISLHVLASYQRHALDGR